MFISNSAEDTLRAGREAAGHARAGDVFALTGDLGAGKTQFAKGFVAAVGCRADVTSPTFTLVHEYSGGWLSIYHFDFYRVTNADELIQLGLDDYMGSDGVCLIEWADRFRELLPDDAYCITFEAADETKRIIRGLPGDEDSGA
jgi:tRNA threonylcarbamoyladenosine biosynthesis protein TsaE